MNINLLLIWDDDSSGDVESTWEASNDQTWDNMNTATWDQEDGA